MEAVYMFTNCVTTECGHVFHATCLLKNTAVNGYACPCCRGLLAEEDVAAEEVDEDEYSVHTRSDYDSEEDYEQETEEEHEEYLHLGFRWFFQRIHGEELEGDAEMYEMEQEEERTYLKEFHENEESKNADFENIMLGLEKIGNHVISPRDLLKAYLYQGHESDSIDSLVNHLRSKTW